jgi:hypothetical protein
MRLYTLWIVSSENKKIIALSSSEKVDELDYSNVNVWDKNGNRYEIQSKYYIFPWFIPAIPSNNGWTALKKGIFSYSEAAKICKEACYNDEYSYPVACVFSIKDFLLLKIKSIFK